MEVKELVESGNEKEEGGHTCFWPYLLIKYVRLPPKTVWGEAVPCGHPALR